VEGRPRVLVLKGRAAHMAAVETLRSAYDVVEADTIDAAITALRRDEFVGVFSDSEDYLPLERALISQQSSLILNTIGEGVCVVDGEGRVGWMNRRMQQWPARVQESVARTCREAYEMFSRVPPADLAPPATPRSRRYHMSIDDAQYLEMIASPVLKPNGVVVQVVAIVWDATSSRRLQQKIDAIDRAGREMMHLDSDHIRQMSVVDRLRLIESKIISYTKELMHFDHFAIRLIDRKTEKLEIVMSAGLPPEALNIELLARAEGNGISGYVAATGRSYICVDVARDPRYVQGLDAAASSLTVPLRLHDRVIGILNVESRHRGAFNEDDRQFAEIFGRYVAMAVNTLDLMVKERVDTSHKITDEVSAELAAPINDISHDIQSLMDDHLENEPLHRRLKTLMDNVDAMRQTLRQAQCGANTTVLGAKELAEKTDLRDPLIAGARVLIVDDEANIRDTISDVLRKYKAVTTIALGARQAIALLAEQHFDLVVSDIKMPDGSGYDIFHAAHSLPMPAPVILMTGFGYDPSHCIVRASQEGVSGVLYKPFRVERMLEEVRKGLSNRDITHGLA
jgi:two-component system, sensor histidine kinase SagS